MQAVLAYLTTLREAQKIPRARVAALVGTTENTIYRIETGRQEPSGSILLGILMAVGARWDDVRRLVSDTMATPEDGQRLAGDVIAETHASVEDRALRDFAAAFATARADQKELLLRLVRAALDE